MRKKILLSKWEILIACILIISVITPFLNKDQTGGTFLWLLINFPVSIILTRLFVVVPIFRNILHNHSFWCLVIITTLNFVFLIGIKRKIQSGILNQKTQQNQKKNINKDFSKIIYQLIFDLVKGNYENLEKDGRIGKLKKSELIQVINSCSGKLTMPPLQVFNELKISKLKTISDTWIVDFNLWFDDARTNIILISKIEMTEIGNFKISINEISK